MPFDFVFGRKSYKKDFITLDIWDYDMFKGKPKREGLKLEVETSLEEILIFGMNRRQPTAGSEVLVCKNRGDQARQPSGMESKLYKEGSL